MKMAPYYANNRGREGVTTATNLLEMQKDQEEMEKPFDDDVGSANRWPQQEVLALLQIRSQMASLFGNNTRLKAPLWDDVSRKLGELGYTRSAKKCKEKFENLHKYYKRTKDGGKSGKSYRFFNQLEALFGITTATTDLAHQSTQVNAQDAPVNGGITTITGSLQLPTNYACELDSGHSQSINHQLAPANVRDTQVNANDAQVNTGITATGSLQLPTKFTSKLNYGHVQSINNQSTTVNKQDTQVTAEDALVNAEIMTGSLQLPIKYASKHDSGCSQIINHQSTPVAQDTQVHDQNAQANAGITTAESLQLPVKCSSKPHTGNRQSMNHQSTPVNAQDIQVNAGITAAESLQLPTRYVSKPYTGHSQSSSSKEMNDINRMKKKRKQTRSGSDNKRLMAMFETIVTKVVEKQEQMQQKFLECLERREEEREMRERAWRKQEMERLSREQELRSQERAMATSRDTALLAFLHKVSTGKTSAAPVAIPSQSQPHHYEEEEEEEEEEEAPVPEERERVVNNSSPNSPEERERAVNNPSSIGINSTEERERAVNNPSLIRINADEERERVAANSSSPMKSNANSNRWPKLEVLELIKLRSSMNGRFQEGVPKRALWEEISHIMGEKGLPRSATRCKEKWENINKYFKKARKSNKARTHNSKTCPYYHELDALYKNGSLLLGQRDSNSSSQTLGLKTLTSLSPSEQQQQQQQ